MNFASDNAAPAHPAVLEAVAAANQGFSASYAADRLMDEVRSAIRAAFEAPEAAVFLVPTGTAANALTLGTLCPPWGTIYCHPAAHVAVDECGAPEFYTGGAKLRTVDGAHGRIDPAGLASAIASSTPGDVHHAQPGALSLTNLTEVGTVYDAAATAARVEIARAAGIPVHLDGARLANAVVATGATLADLTWRAGVDAVSFGGTKNGLMDADAVVLFDPARAWEFELRRKRGGHLFSKHRYLSAQMQAYLADGLWLDLARRANAAGARLAAGLQAIDGASLVHPVDANMIFVSMPRALHERARAGGAVYHMVAPEPPDEGPDQPLSARLVTSWCTTEEDVDRFLDLLAAG